MEYIILALGLFGLSAIINLYNNGYIGLYYKIIKVLYQFRTKITPELIENFDKINIVSTLNNNTKSKTKIFNKTIHIYYDYLGKEYLVILPYDKYKSVDMGTYDIAAVYKNEGKIVNISQQPGVPYLVTAEEIECEQIIAYNGITDAKYVYEKEIAPLYCDEISND